MKKIVVMLLSGCVCLSVGAVAQEQKTLSKNIQAGAVAPLAQSNYLSVDDRAGITWFDAQGKRKAHLAASAELLDVRENVEVNYNNKLTPFDVAATVLLPEQQAALIALDKTGKKIIVLARLPIPAFKIENLCLSRDTANNLSLYLLDERGTAEHWLVLDANGNQQIKKLRSLPIAPNSKSCSVDDAGEHLLIAEESIGVWAYGASVESSPGRRVVDMSAPFGRLSEAAELVSAVPGGLLVFDGEQKKLHAYRTDKLELINSIAVNDIDEAEHLAARYDPATQQITAVLFDEGKKQHHEVVIPWGHAHTLAQKKSALAISSVTADAQTHVMARFGDAADDPAIWVNKHNPQQSRVIGTNKQQGLFVYDLQGKEVQHFNTGKLNNVDVRYGIPVGQQQLDIAVATNRDDNSLAIYTIDPATGNLNFSGSVKTNLEEIYGFCMYQSPASANAPVKTYAIPNAKSGEFQQIELTATIDKKKAISWKGKVVRRFFVKSQPEGCVADDQHQRLFIGEEDVALWTLGADANASPLPQLVLAAGDTLVADVEGVGVYAGKEKSYVVVSSQGNNTFVVMDALPPFNVRGIVRIDLDAANNIDGVSETDGLEVSSVNFGGAFSEGLLVVQDGHKVMPEAPQNFKYVAWKKIREALQLE
ncbi:phytase [Cellvibrio mixtus]|uniref:phytase n=1 Tax=Cellvibrio mixtus TaxID=39650 RepID=UPI000694CF1A|nr:phytase [Cellvibrio mixtus]